MKLTAQDLRIGNYVQFPAGTIYKVDILYDSYKSLEYWKPIPLTEEWLLKLGFEYYKPLNHYRMVLNDIWFEIRVSDIFVFSFTNLNYDEENHMPPKVIQRVHQLQNLYFALTGEELEIK